MAQAERSSSVMLIPLLVGALIALSLGTYGRIHDPTGELIFDFGFSATLNMKAWFATAAATLALFQLASALRMYGKVPWPKEMPKWLPRVHRWTGRTAFLFTIPVAYHCLWSLGFQDYETRVLVHSLAGCFFYGAFVAKVIVVRSKNTPAWLLPTVGGALFTLLIVIWSTSALWFFQNIGFPEF